MRSYTGHIERYFVPVIGHIRLSELRVDHVAEVFEMLDEHNALCRKGKATRPVGPASSSAYERRCEWHCPTPCARGSSR